MTLAEPMADPARSRSTARLGLTDDELDAIRDRLGAASRTTSSSRCSASCGASTARTRARKPLLRTLPTAGEGVVAGPGENAGVISIGDGLAVAFKIESHNHPSAVEPYQGAATGVGGILRDIFTMGARPIAVLDALRFGDPSIGPDAPPRRRRRPRRRRLRQLRRRADGRRRARLRPVLRGQPARQRDGDRPARGAAASPAPRRRARATSWCCSARRPAATGSAGRPSSPARRSATRRRSKRPSVQVGDPFAEKLLIEASLELIERGLVEGLQDLGAAGITCATSETADRAGTGMRDRPRRDPAPRAGHGAVRGDDLRVAGADARDRPTRALGRRPRRLRALGPAGRGDRRRSRTTATSPSSTGTSGARPHPGRGPHQRRDRPRADRRAAAPPPAAPAPGAPATTRAAAAGARHGPGRGAPRAPRLGQPRRPPAGLRAVRLDRPGEHRRRARAGAPRCSGSRAPRRRSSRRPTATQAVGRRDPWLGAAMSVAEATRNVVDHRRAAARRHELPQLRRPDPAGGVLAAVRGRPRPGRRVPRARPAGHRRQRLALQRVARRPRSPRRPRSGSSGCSTTSIALVGPAFRADGDAIVLVGEATPGLAGQRVRAARGRRAGGRPAGARPRPASAALQAFVREAAARGLLASAQDVVGRRPRGRPRRVRDLGRRDRGSAPACGCRSRTRRRSTCSARARRGSSSRRRRATSPALVLLARQHGLAVEELGSVGGERLVVELAGAGATGAAEERGSRVADALDVAARRPPPRLGARPARGPSAGTVTDDVRRLRGRRCRPARAPRPRPSPRSACSRSSTAARSRPASRSATASSSCSTRTSG